VGQLGMDQPRLNQLGHAQRERLAHIEHFLMFRGEATRIELVERFGIAAAQATNDLSLYRELAPNNIGYDKSRRVHTRGLGFEPLFEYDVQRALASLCQGYGSGSVGTEPSPWRCEAPHQLNAPEISIVAALCEAIYRQCPVSITYVSLSSGEQRRTIVPHTLVDNGLRWHVRAYDRKRQQFRDFVLTRMKKVKIESAGTESHESFLQDKQWNRFVELELVPHPSIKHKEAIELDYQMSRGVLHRECRAAVAGYLLRRWNVDCSADHSLVGAENQLWLRNRATLYGVENLTIAPGYKNLSGDTDVDQRK
jgi:hypothetical protein